MNNPESVKLEVFTITLKPVEGYDNDRLEDLIVKKIDLHTEKDYFTSFYELFIKNIEAGYTEVRSKAFTLSTDDEDYGHNPKQQIIWGVLKGGPKGSGKTKSPINNRSDEEDLNGHVINDKFFFYLHFPLDKNFGYLLFQTYGNINIRPEFTKHILSLFKLHNCYNLPTLSAILPNSVRDEFKNNSKIVELSYLNQILPDSITDDQKFSNLCDKYNIEISIKPVGKGYIPSDKQTILNQFLSQIKLNNISLFNYKKKKVTVQNLETQKKSTFEIDTNDVMPKIYLNGRIQFDDNGTPNFHELKKFCDDLLKELIEDEYTQIKRK